MNVIHVIIPDERVVHRPGDHRVISTEPQLAAVNHRRPIDLDQQKTLAVTAAAYAVQLPTKHMHTLT